MASTHRSRKKNRALNNKRKHKFFVKNPVFLFFLTILSTSVFVDILQAIYPYRKRGKNLPLQEMAKKNIMAIPERDRAFIPVPERVVVPVPEEMPPTIPERIFSSVQKWKSLVVSFWEKPALLLWIAVGVIGLVTFNLRAFQLGRSFDIFIDEFTYLQISQTIASTLHVQLYGQPFFLHPPAFFFIEAILLRIFQPAGDVIQQIYAMRFINVTISCLSAVLIFLICYRVMGWSAGLIAGILFAINPFIIQIDSLNILEASAIGWIIAGYWVLISGMKEEPLPWSLPGIPVWRKILTRKGFFERASPMVGQAIPVPAWRMVVAGLFFGLALLTKETTAFLTLIPLAVFFILRWSIPRRAALVTGFVACLVYSIYPLTVYLSGDWALFAHQKLRGILRFIGILKITGLNRTGGPSLLSTVISRSDQYATTYAIIALGTIATLILLTSRGSLTRLIGVWTASAYAMLAYLIFLGTLEEQFFIYLVVPSLIACTIAAALLLKSFTLRQERRMIAIPLIISLILFAGWDGYQWYHVHTTPDNGYEQIMAYLRKNVPGGERVASTSEIGQYVLGGYLSGPFGLWSKVNQLTHYSPEYLLVTPQTLEWNYGESGKELLDWVDQHGTYIYGVTGREGDQILLYQLDFKRGKNISKP
jgi:hypothetical protein